MTSYTPSLPRLALALASALAFAGCDSEAAPLEPESVVTYDLLYESFVSPTVLQQSLSGGQPIAPAAGVGLGIDPTATLDGRYIAYAQRNLTDGGSVLRIVDRQSGSITPISDGSEFIEQPAFSPDGTRIAFTRSSNGSSDIFVVNRDGSGIRQLTTDPLPAVVFDHLPAWSPDGTRIMWSNNESGFLRLWVMNSDGSNKHRLTSSVDTFEDDAAWSPDGTRIAFFEVVTSTPKLVIVNADGTNRQTPTLLPNGVARHPAWSPDGQLIAFTFIPSNGSRPQIYTMKPDGTDIVLRTLDSQNRGGHHPAFIRR